MGYWGTKKKVNNWSLNFSEASEPRSPEAFFVPDPGSVDSSLEASVLHQDQNQGPEQSPLTLTLPFSRFSFNTLGNTLSTLLQTRPPTEEEQRRAEFDALMDPTGGGMIF